MLAAALLFLNCEHGVARFSADQGRSSPRLPRTWERRKYDENVSPPTPQLDPAARVPGRPRALTGRWFA